MEFNSDHVRPATTPSQEPDTPQTTADLFIPVDTGSASTGFLLWGAAIVFFMVPGLALFYSGLSRYNNALSLMMLCMMALAVVCIQWFLFGYSLAFSENGGLFIGDFSVAAFDKVGSKSFPHTAPAVPGIAFALFQMQFAGITAALVFGSVPERCRFVPAMVFVFFWTTIVYDPIAYWTWANNGFLRNIACLGRVDYYDKPCTAGGALDFAGGGPVHITAGFSGLAYLVVLGKRRTIHAEHHNMVNVMFGCGVLWFGWFAFNGGSAGAANTRAAIAAMNTALAASSGGLTWAWMDFISSKKLSAFSFCSGVVAGLVAITPGSGFVPPWAAVVIGAAVAAICDGCCRVKARLKIDDSFDAGSLHGCGGFLGNILAGVFAKKWVAELDGTDISGGLFDGNWIQVFYQLVASAIIAVWAFFVSFILLWTINKIPGLNLRQNEADEAIGGDMAEMGEAGYILSAPDTATKSHLELSSRRNTIHPLQPEKSVSFSILTY